MLTSRHTPTTRNRRGRGLAAAAVLTLLTSLAAVLQSAPAGAATVPTGFTEVTAFTGLANPTAVRFAPDGRIFVAEKRGTIQMYDGLTDTTPTQVADLRTEVHNFWDRGLLGLAIDPGFPTRPYLYALYTFDAPIGGTAPRWGAPGVDSDPCPTPPGPSTDGCVVSSKLVRLTLTGSTTTSKDLINDWCQQYPSHSAGDLVFGGDGALYVSGGDGASFDFVDYGQAGSPANPCGNPADATAPPDAQGGALRAQGLRTAARPVSLDGTVIRVSPDTGAALPDNPNSGASDPNARRIVAYGLRNPFRMALRPGTGELWTGDVGWNTQEEVNRLPAPAAGVTDLGWPCFEGPERQSAYAAANLRICEDLYAQGAADTKPFFSYVHGRPLSASDSCDAAAGAAVTGISFSSGGPYPAAYDGTLFVADYARRCIWAISRGSNGLPDVTTARPFVSPAAAPVDVQTSPGGELFYADTGGTIRRIVHTGTSLTSCATGTHSARHAPHRTTSAAPVARSCPARPPGHDRGGGGPAGVPSGDVSGRRPARNLDRNSATDSPPRPQIDTPLSGTTWQVGQAITFSGSATDPEDGPLAASALSWEMDLEHCPSACHTHVLQQWTGVPGASIAAPDHEYPSHLELRLTATDSQGQRTTVTRRLDPRTVPVTVTSQPSGLQVALGPGTAAAPFTATLIVGSTTTVSAPSPQTSSGATYQFSGWSDGGAQTHPVTTGSTAATYTARYTLTACTAGRCKAGSGSDRTLPGAPGVGPLRDRPLARN